MIDQAVHSPDAHGVEGILRADLARGDAMVDTVLPILRHLVVAEDNSIFSDEILTRVRSMLSDLATGILDALARLGGDGAPGQQADSDEVDVLSRAFVDNPALLRHVHALALEWQLTERLQGRLAIDPVVSPLLQAQISSGDVHTQQLAMTFLAAQARWCQAQRRMKLSLAELPGDLLHGAIMTLRSLTGTAPGMYDAIMKVEDELRQSYDEGASRLGLAARLVHGLGRHDQGSQALSVINAGVPLFLTALAAGIGHSRDAMIFATHESQLARLALALRAAGLRASQVEEEFLAFHPEITLPEGFEQLDPQRAASILGAGTGRGA